MLAGRTRSPCLSFERHFAPLESLSTAAVGRRPGGSYTRQISRTAIWAGVSRIINPVTHQSPRSQAPLGNAGPPSSAGRVGTPPGTASRSPRLQGPPSGAGHPRVPKQSLGTRTWDVSGKAHGRPSVGFLPPSYLIRPAAASRLATSAAVTSEPASATPLPAMSYAVPWATLVRTIGRPARDVHRPPAAAQLHRDVPLVVVHRHDAVELALVAPARTACRPATGPSRRSPRPAPPPPPGR